MSVWQIVVKESTTPTTILAETFEQAVERFRASEKDKGTAAATIASVSRLVGIDIQ